MMFTTLRIRALRPVLLFALVLFAIKAAFVIATPLRALVMSPWLIDDSFIVMRIARNIALGHGFSFDMTHPTTGVSMLWAYLTSLNHLIFPKEIAVKATLIASIFFGSLATIITTVIAWNLSRDRVTTWITLLLTSLMPVLFFNAMNGMETAFFSVLILLAVGGSSGCLHFSSKPAAQWAWVGFFTGLALMTRADAIFVAAAIGIFMIVDWLRMPINRKDIVKNMIVFFVVCALCFSIFLLWQMIQTGTPFPDNQIGRRAIALADHHFSYDNFSLPAYLRIVVWNDFQLEALWSLGIGSSVLGLLALLWQASNKTLQPLLRVIALYIVLFCTTLIAYQWYFPDFHGLRYLNPAMHIVLFFIASFLALWPALRWRATLLTVFLTLLLILSWYRYFDYARRPQWATGMTLFGNRNVQAQNAFFATIDLIKEQLPQDAVIAVRDHGRIAFFTDRSIQDLAGIIDPDILTAYEDNRLAQYLSERNVTYVYLPNRVLGQESIYEALYRSLQLEQVEDAPKEGVYGFTLYRIVR